MQVPDTIGRYRITGRLGSGAFATVWLAEDDLLESRVAIKILADNWSHHPDVRARFEQEAQVLRRADSERLVRVHDFGELPDGRPYQVMTYAAGGTLQDRLDQGPMPVRTALRTAGDIARAVSVLHDSGVLHRDLKPSNVLFDTVRGAERLLVADLGLAKEIAHASGFTVVVGTPGYMAPEQLLPGGGLDVRADVHAIGAMTYQMLTGSPPQAGRATTVPSKLRAGVSREVDRVVMRALDADRDRRWPSTAAFATALASSTTVTPSRALRLLRNGVGSVLAVALLAQTGGATVVGGTPPGWVRVTDAAGAVSVSVPGAWARQLRDAGWNVAAVGLPAASQPGLQISADLSSDTAPGLFAGLLAPGATATVPTHPGCLREPDRTIAAAGMTGRVQRWTSCAGDTVSYDEVVLSRPGDPGAYLQIRQGSRDTDRTDGILRTLRVPHS
ncbi:serine/threonine-protein kinase [Actinoplanes derwentensis]|uniref:non-specific serine/threonine protein kinase n=1 Tax=Actinoplanes derwentensis TaxID=113562 RepID=A0A1H2CR62_9ACTN|nr:serine/threonine-protein kinase [Actinoplanes derwentensis]GID89868.1 serine/threonine protein kinase [Actinoplanes derwentensis]SDT73035.1 Serine/threonine protein kinase [Actinoplanes derwentensis]